MAQIRGSTQKLIYIKEVTFGTTPATPTMTEIPLAQISTKKSTQTVLKSNQIRSHPFVDRMLYGQFVHDLAIDVELQAASHDALFETMFGGTITTKSLPFADVLKSITAENQAGGSSSLFDQYSGCFFDSVAISAAASDTAPVKCTFTGRAKVGTLDAGATLASVVTAATFTDPYVFADATLTVGGSATAVMSGNFTIARKVDPLMLWGSRTPREYVNGDVTVTGKVTVPYDGSVQSTIVTAFSDAALVFNFANVGATTHRAFTMAKAKLMDLSKPITSRLGVFQDIDFEAYFDSGTSTAVTMTTE